MAAQTRNWTVHETNLFCAILVDPVKRFMVTLEKKALKKNSNKDVFEQILIEMKNGFKREPFRTLNAEILRKKKSTELILSVKKLQMKYNNIKQTWKKMRDKQNNGSEHSNNPYWYYIVNPFLSDTASLIMESEETSLIEGNDSNDYADTEWLNRQVAEDVSESEHMPTTQIKTEAEETEDIVFDKTNILRNQEETSSPPPSPETIRNIVTELHEKRSSASSQIQVLDQIASAVNKLVEINEKRMEIEERDRKALLDFRREEADKNRQHEKEMANFYARTLGMQRQAISQTRPLRWKTMKNTKYHPISLKFP